MNVKTQGMNAERLFDFLYHQQDHFPQDKMICRKKGKEWSYRSTQETIQVVNQLSTGLINLGIQKGDKIAIVVEQNRPEWLIVDLAVQQTGAILVPVYPTISEQDYAYIFKEAEVKICFTDAGELLDKMVRLQKKLDSFEQVYCLDPGPKAPFWEDLLTKVQQKVLDEHKNNISRDDLATIIYTSGTTGMPKGVMLTHWNIVSNVLSAYDLIPCERGEKVMSFLPLCHIFEKVVTYAYLAAGVSITYTGLDNLGGEQGDLRAIKPHFFTAVPRLLEKVYEKIMYKGSELTGFKKKLFYWALDLAKDYQFDRKVSGLEALKWTLADRLVFSKWRHALGGNVKGILTGAAACPPDIIRAFSAAGIPIREGYGLTEAAPGISINRYDEGQAMIGTVGPLLDGVEVELDYAGEFKEGEGEILATGPNIMQGYYRQPEKSEEVLLHKDGKTWLRTGDVGTFVTNEHGVRFLKITDRKKELLKTSGGKYVAPSPIESALKQDLLIENVMIVGEQRKFVAALIVPALEMLRIWCKENDVYWTNVDDILNHPKVVAMFQKVVDKYNHQFARFEQIKRFQLIDSPWEIVKPDGTPGELTPTLKLKRRVIMERWGDIIDKMYQDA